MCALATMKVLLLALLSSAAVAEVGPFKSFCTDDIKCQDVAANNLTFHCRVSGPADGAGVLLLHGFPEWSQFYIPLMEDWVTQKKPWRAVACDLRGYSPKASPDDHTQYTHAHLCKDMLAIADAFSFAKFHLVGHDHGAGLGWSLAKLAPSRVLSYSAFSVPHPDAWSSTLAGANADVQSQAMFNYANQMSLVDSASKMFGLMGKTFADAAAFQKALWWYNGSIGTALARPPVLGDADIAKYAASWVQLVRMLIPIAERPGVAQSEPIGAVSVPTLFVCGAKDEFIKCGGMGDLYEKGGNYVTGPYTYLSVKCGHNVLGKCDSKEENKKVHAAVSKLIENPDAKPDDKTSSVETSSGSFAKSVIVIIMAVFSVSTP